jgi:hypothetical protein
MAESASTRRMYEGELDHEEDDMPRSLEEEYNASRSDEPANIGESDRIEYDQEAMAEAIQAYKSFEAEVTYENPGPTQDEEALDAFGELWSED